MASKLVGVPLVLLLSLIQPAVGFERDDKCSACHIVMDELELAVEAESNEHNRMDLDMKARLDSKGKRQGKIVNYEMSEVGGMVHHTLSSTTDLARLILHD